MTKEQLLAQLLASGPQATRLWAYRLGKPLTDMEVDLTEAAIHEEIEAAERDGQLGQAVAIAEEIGLLVAIVN